MELNSILLIIVGISIGVTLWRSIILFSIKYNWGWVFVSIGIIFSVGLAFAFAPQFAGIVATVLWILFIIIPSTAERTARNQAQQLQYQKASWTSRIASLLHPFDGWWLRPRYYQAQALEKSGKFAEASQIFEQFTAHPQLAFAAYTSIYTMRGQWEEFIHWLETHKQLGIKQDPGVLYWYLRAMGEVGAINKMINCFAQYRSTLEKDHDRLYASYLIIFGFSGQITYVEKLLRAPLNKYPPDRKKLWIATANLAAGHADEAKLQLKELLSSEDYTLRKIAEKRLLQPFPHATDVLTPEAEMVLEHAKNEMDANLHLYKVPTNKRQFAYSTLVLIAINFLVFGLEILLGGSTDIETLYQLGALWTPAVVDGELWRLITATFLHFGAIHLVLNMYALYILGSHAEMRFGIRWSVIVYLLSGFGSMLLLVMLIQAGMLEQTLALGASGAILGLLGAIAASDFRIWRTKKSGIAQSRLRGIAFVILIQVLIKLVVPQISLTLHLGGVIIGFVATLLVEEKFLNRQSDSNKA